MLLKTKLYPPELSDFTVNRQQLQNRLSDAANAGKHIIISAGAGFGKSTLLAQWLKQENALPAWISLDEYDNDPLRFLKYLTAALCRRYGINAEPVEVLLKDAGSSGYQTVLETLLELITLIEERVIIVLDDFHLIENQEVIRGIEFLLRHAGANCSFVFLTRIDPPVSLSRLRLNQRLLELRESDLRFTGDETAGLLENVINDFEKRRELADLLTKKTEGWIVGLRLAVLAFTQENSDSQFIDRFSGSHTFVADYLIEEVIGQINEEEEEILLTASLFDRFSSELIDSVLQKPCSDKLNYLKKTMFFLIPLDEENSWFRFHHLVADLLKKRVYNRWTNDRIANLLSLASGWFEKSGLIDEAIHAADRSGISQVIIRLIATHAIKLIATGELHTVSAWMELISPDDKLSSPDLCVIDGWLASLRQDVQRVAFSAKQAESIKDQADQIYLKDLEGHLSLLRANYLLHEPGTSPEEILRLLNSAANRIKRDNLLLHGILELFRGNFHRMTGNLEEAESALQKAILYSGQLNDFSLLLPACTAISEILILRGKLYEAEKILLENLAKVHELFKVVRIPQVGMLHILLARILLEWNNPDEAEENLELAGEISQRTADYNALVVQFELMGRLKLLKGDVRGASECLDRAKKLADSKQMNYYKAFFIHLTFLIRKQSGNHFAIEQCLDLAEKYRNGFAFWMGQTEMTRIQTLAELNRLKEAFAEAVQLIDIANSKGAGYITVKATVWSSIILWKLNRKKESLDYLYEALQQSASMGVLRTILDSGFEICEALKALASEELVKNDGSTIEMIRFLLLEIENEKNRTPEGLAEPLSNRELEVLRLLAAGLTNKEIGEQLFLALGTVKKHSFTIYQKLGVKNRIQAIEKSRELRLI